MASSPPSSTNKKRFPYDVFLSFRGVDTRKSFIDHLYVALKDRGIITYKDDTRLEIGTEISEELLNAIDDSKLHIIVFSKTYASSAWCLNELVKIMECSKTTEHTAYPVFYDVEPTEVRHQTGDVKKAFAKLENESKAGEWREALTQAANLCGSSLMNNDNGHEAKFIKRVVEYVFRQLSYINSYIDNDLVDSDSDLVGMEPRVKGILSSLKKISSDEVRMIGISGIGGGGKTTLARTVFGKICMDFEGISFVENIREVFKKEGKSGLQKLQKQIISEVINAKNIILTGVDNGINIMMKMMRGKKVLIVLDDVDHNYQLEALAGDRKRFKAGSTFIITTRDKQILKSHGVMQIHDVDLLSDMEAAHLFNRYAFRADTPNHGYEELCLKFVRYAEGLPLFIRVLGSFLYGKEEDQWRDQMERLKKFPMKETQKILKLSYNSLNVDSRDIFLDVACFLRGLHKDDAIRILESCGLNAKSGLRELELKSLVKFSSDQHLDMHERIQEMGRNIVRGSYPDDPQTHSRLWEHGKIEEVLENKLVCKETTGMALDDCLDSEIVAKGFGNITKLKFLRMVSEKEDNYSS